MSHLLLIQLFLMYNVIAHDEKQIIITLNFSISNWKSRRKNGAILFPGFSSYMVSNYFLQSISPEIFPVNDI